MRAARAVALALAAGIWAQLLAVGQLGGINVLLWVAFVLGAALLVRRPGATLDRLDYWLPIAALVFAAFIALRDEAMLFTFNLPMSGALTLAAAVALGGHPLTRSSASVVTRSGGAALLLGAVGAVLLGAGLTPIRERSARSSGAGLSAVVRGALVALPLLLVFLVLFVAADAVFESQVRNLLSFDFASELPLRLVVAVLAGWLFAGTMAATWLAKRSPAPAEATQGNRSRGASIEALVVLLLLDGLFAVFVAIQAAYLFGGLDTVAAAGLTYAEYARRGFFELVVVATIVGLVLLVVGRRVASSPTVKAAAIVLALLTGVILVSASLRLGLYQSAFGWSELRFYVVAAIVWLGACLLAAVVALAMSRSGWLLHAWLAAGFAVAIGVNAIGPQQFSTAANVERVINPGLVADNGTPGLDVDYLSWFGADAVPVLLAARDRLPPPEAAAVDRLLHAWAASLRDQASTVGWPSWNLSRAMALEQLREAGY